MSELDADLDAFLEVQSERFYKQCSVAYVLEQLPQAQREKLARVIDANVIPSARIASMLSKNGYEVRDANISRHRRRLTGAAGCTCP